jgi:CRISPR-associated helicase Cas3
MSTLPVEDIGDLAANRRVQDAGGRCRLRVHTRVMFPRDVGQQQALSMLLRRMRLDDEDALTDLKQFVRVGIAGQEDLEFADKHVNWQQAEPYSVQGLLAESRWIRAAVRRGSSNPEETDENDTASLTGREVLLADHTDGVIRKVSQFAAGCGISGPLSTALTFAATCHDLGKWDDRFQMLLSDRDINEPPLAKRRSLRPRGFRRRRELSGYPAGARYAFRWVGRWEPGKWQEECDRELVLHLIGTHHGHGRPFVPVWTDDPNLEIRARMNGDQITIFNVPAIARLDSGWIDQFWLLSRRYGFWGLAYLEAILRRADCVRSREEQEVVS